jgi:hypothetical protein
MGRASTCENGQHAPDKAMIFVKFDDIFVTAARKTPCSQGVQWAHGCSTLQMIHRPLTQRFIDKLFPFRHCYFPHGI